MVWYCRDSWYVQEYQWAYTPAFERDNVATAGFDQDVSAMKAFVS